MLTRTVISVADSALIGFVKRKHKNSTRSSSPQKVKIFIRAMLTEANSMSRPFFMARAFSKHYARHFEGVLTGVKYVPCACAVMYFPHNLLYIYIYMYYIYKGI